MHRFFRPHQRVIAFGFLVTTFVSLLSAQSNPGSLREIAADVKDTRGPVDRFFDLSLGSDYPGTLIREDSHAQLKLVTSELGFRCIRFHAIFHDVLGTVSSENGKTLYDWAKIDHLNDRHGWRDLVGAFVRHVEERYGKDEVRSWYFEVWNEPNLSGFWEGGDHAFGHAGASACVIPL